MKELHSTLIRLLNELSPWEPKLVKAFQRNRYSICLIFKIYLCVIVVLVKSFPGKSVDFMHEYFE